jgi:flagellar basal-body rod modification protein FlgD
MSTLPVTNAIPSSTDAASTAAQRTDAGVDLGTNAFMKLLISELKNQDPLDPMQSRDMIAQLAQLSSVEKLDSINASIGTLNSGISGMSNRESAGLIGKTITANGSNLRLGDIGSVSTRFTVNANAEDVSAIIRDSKGNAIRTVDLGEAAAGAHQITWDGKEDSGIRAPAGTYLLGISAKDSSGNPITTSLQISGQVAKIVYDNGSAELDVNGVKVNLNDVLSISQ